jgi:CTP-dependent riboflavin kinase
LTLIEIIAPLSLRESMDLQDGDEVEVVLDG